MASGLSELVGSVATEYLAKCRSPGVSIAVRAEGEEASVALGVPDAECSSVTLSPATVFRVGSVSKLFTASAAFGLVQAGVIELDTHVSRILSDLYPDLEGISLRHLLSHTSGLTDRAASRVEAAAVDYHARPLLERYERSAEPGFCWRYCNAGFGLVAALIERLTGCDYAEYLYSNVIARAGLHSTYIGSPKSPRVAKGHAKVGAGFGYVSDPPATVTKGSGDVWSSAGELVAWAEALFSGRVVSEDLLREMTTPVRPADGSEVSYGLAVYKSQFCGNVEISHDGSSAGFSCQLATYPASNVSVAVCINSSKHDAESVEKNISRQLLGLTPDIPLDIELTPDEIQAVTGEYSTSSEPIRVWDEGSKVFIRTPGGETSRLLWQGSSEFVQESDSTIKIVFNPDGGDVSRNGKMLERLTRLPSAILKNSLRDESLGARVF